jgi:hypothetical protein
LAWVVARLFFSSHLKNTELVPALALLAAAAFSFAGQSHPSFNTVQARAPLAGFSFLPH